MDKQGHVPLNRVGSNVTGGIKGVKCDEFESPLVTQIDSQKGVIMQLNGDFDVIFHFVVSEVFRIQV